MKSEAMNGTAVFLDKDGTLIQDVPYNVDPERIRLTAGAEHGLRLLHAAGYALIVVSNQSGVARGFFSEEALVAVEARLRELLAAAGVPLTGFYYCPHHSAGAVAEYAVACACRKPQPGMIVRGARDHGIDLSRSWLIGDILDDVEAGHRAGCRTVLIANGNETAWVMTAERRPDYVVADLAEAAKVVLAHGGEPHPPSPSRRKSPTVARRYGAAMERGRSLAAGNRPQRASLPVVNPPPCFGEGPGVGLPRVATKPDPTCPGSSLPSQGRDKRVRTAATAPATGVSE